MQRKQSKLIDFIRIRTPISLFFLLVFFSFAVVFFGWYASDILLLRQEHLARRDALRAMGMWFIANQTDRGDFVYERNVPTGLPIDGYNIVRQAGSLYSLAQLLHVWNNDVLRETLENGFAFFQSFAEEQEEPRSAAIVFSGQRKANASALLLLALVEAMEQDRDMRVRYRDFADRLANFLVSTQTDEGWYAVTSPPDVASDYNNGETFYALIRMYRLSKNDVYLQSARNAAEYFLRFYDDGRFHPAFYSWGMAGFAHLIHVDPDERFWVFMRRLTDAYFRETGYSTVRYFQGASGIPPRANLAVFSEGIAHTAWISRTKDPRYFLFLSRYLSRSIDSLVTLQIGGERSRYSSPLSVLQGGICSDISCQTLRIDIVHHTLSSFYLFDQYVL